MEEVVVKVEETVKDLVEKVEDKVEDVVKDLAEKVEDKVEDVVKDLAEKVEDKVEELIKKVEDDHPSVKIAVDAIETKLAEVVDGRVLSCSCWGFLWTLRITRKTPQSSLPKPEDSVSKLAEQPPQSTQQADIPQTKAETPTQ